VPVERAAEHSHVLAERQNEKERQEENENEIKNY
jgi:hypothetical protein